MPDDKVIKRVINGSTHVVLLGAGASKASLPNGDKNGNIVPLMNELNLIPEVKTFFSRYNLEIGEVTFEEFYSNLVNANTDKHILIELNEIIYSYFKGLQLPDHPTIYDYLVLSLKESDVIATFNWDPFLVQAYIRAKKITSKLPRVFFLHGTVALGRCAKHKIVDLTGNYCPKCNNPLDEIQLLYPTSFKNYTEDEYIKEQWDGIQFYLKRARGMTIFGYAAPQSDVAAINLLKDGWGSNGKRVMEEIDIINIDKPENLRMSWNDFIHETHYTIWPDYFQSSIANFPRRVSEYQFGRFNLNLWLSDHKIKPNLSFSELNKNIRELVEYESS